MPNCTNADCPIHLPTCFPSCFFWCNGKCIHQAFEAEFNRINSKDDSPWVCQNCGKHGGFKLLGNGFIACEGCLSQHFVLSNGSIELLGVS